MAFLLRQVSHSAAGREIIRASRVEGDRLAIGRDPASDIHLTDLAVALHHAIIVRTGAGPLEIAATAGLRIEIDGRTTAAGTIQPAAGGDIRIASHILRVMPTASGADEVAISIEKVGESDGKTHAADERRFSLGAVMPGKRATAWLGLLLVLALCLAWPIASHFEQTGNARPTRAFHADSLWSPGKLSRAHAGLENNCGACHVKAFVSVRDDSCRACHDKVHDHADPFRLARARPGVGGWGKVRLAFKQAFNLPPGRCIDCHNEHQGAQAMPVTAQHFCSDCHATLKQRIPDTRLADVSDFGTRHPQFAPAVLTRWNGDRPVVRRLSLDGRPREDSGLKFPHALHLSRTNGVAQMARRLGADYGFGQALGCRDCHVPTPDGVRFQPVVMEANCAMCHSLAFDRQSGIVRTLRHGDPAQVVADLRDFYRAPPRAAPAMLGGIARRRPGEASLAADRGWFAGAATGPARADHAIRALFSPGGACYDCHRIDPPPAGSLAFHVRPVALPVRYMDKGWFDHRAHATQSCASCHAANRSNAASDLLLPGIDSCRACHGGEGAAKAVPSSCALCHDYHFSAGQPAMLERLRLSSRSKDADPFAGRSK